MRIVITLLYYDEALAPRGAAEYLRVRPHQRQLGAALAQAGHDVEVVILFPTDAILMENGVTLRLMSPGAASRALGLAAHRLGRARALYEPAFRAIEAIVRARADVVHFHSTTLHVNLALLALHLHDEVLVVQYHGGGGPATNPVSRMLQRAGLVRADRVLFTSAAQARPFLSAGVLDSLDRVRTALEVSTLMTAPDREEARRRSGLVGSPIFVSAGRLEPEKDPLTVVRGFEIIARRWPDSRLYLCYSTDTLLPLLRQHVAERPELRERVRFLGWVSHDDMAAILGSADFYVQASLREVAGYAVLEAIAAGAVPVLTRIPAFEVITAERLGVLFPPGDADALARGVLTIDRTMLAAHRTILRTYFDAHLSFPALARRLETIYAEAIASRGRAH
jgi:glycosyltransferase involved in cell wall biosynthesis